MLPLYEGMFNFEVAPWGLLIVNRHSGVESIIKFRTLSIRIFQTTAPFKSFLRRARPLQKSRARLHAHPRLLPPGIAPPPLLLRQEVHHLQSSILENQVYCIE